MTAPLIIDNPCPRAVGLACALSARIVRSGSQPRRLILPGRKARQFTLLYNAGFSAIRRGGSVLFVPDDGETRLTLYKALALAKIPSGGKISVDEAVSKNTL